MSRIVVDQRAQDSPPYDPPRDGRQPAEQGRPAERQTLTLLLEQLTRPAGKIGLHLERGGQVCDRLSERGDVGERAGRESLETRGVTWGEWRGLEVKEREIDERTLVCETRACD